MATKTEPITEATRFQDAMRTIMSVPKKEIDRREADWKKSQDEKKKSRSKWKFLPKYSLKVRWRIGKSNATENLRR